MLAPISTRLVVVVAVVLAVIAGTGRLHAAKLSATSTEQPGLPPVYTEVLMGSTAELTCDLKSTVQGDYVLLVLWYKDGETMPFYSVDARGKYLKDAQHWSDEKVLFGRAHLKAATDKVRLLMEPVLREDEGIYKCRVDFKKSPTRHHRIQLAVITPVSRPVVTDAKGIEVRNVSGLYDLGASLTLICTVTQGLPVPRVMWYEDDRLMPDGILEYLPSKQIRHVIQIGSLGRSNHNVRYSCAASNSRVFPPAIAAVTVLMRLPLLEVRIEKEKSRAVSSGKAHQVTCRAIGSSPPARISWWKAGERLQATHETTSSDGNISYSSVTLMADLDDGGQYLICRAENHELPASVIEDTLRLDVQYVPIVRLELGSKLKLEAIKEGDDVYMECSIRANPWVTKVAWKHNGKMVHHNSSAGIIMSNQSLVLQRIDRSTAGLYTCIATNVEGQGESNTLALPVKFRPLCESSQQTSYGASRHETVVVRCSVDAHPSGGVGAGPDQQLTFRWLFNSSMIGAVEVAGNSISSLGRQSNVTHRVITELDYGTLLCWARNSIGEQREPCIYTIQPAGEPSPPANCSVNNITTRSLQVSCIEGYDGGLGQSFSLQVFRQLSVKQKDAVVNIDAEETSGNNNNNNRAAVTSFSDSATAEFTVSQLEPGTGYELHIWANNYKGRSPNVVIMVETTVAGQPIERRAGLVGPTTQAVVFHMTPILGALIGIVATLIIVAVAIVFIVRTRGRSGEDSATSPGASVKSFGDRSAAASSGGSVNSSKRRLVEHDVSTDEELNPDVVPGSKQGAGAPTDGSSTRNVGVSTISMTGPISLHYTPAVMESSSSPYVTAPLVYTTHHLSYPSTAEQDLMLGHVAVPMVMRTTSGADHHQQQQQQQQQGAVRGGPGAVGLLANTYTVDSFNKGGSVMSPRRQYLQQQHHHYPHQQQLSVSVIEEELSTVSTPLMSTASSTGSGISTLTRSGVPNPRESAV